MTKDVDRGSVDELLRAVSPSRAAEALGIAVVKRGANLRCVCPFHDDHDPSLVLYDEWDTTRPPHHHCFVCGADGDIFDLVQQVRHVSFGEAVDWLRSTFGLPQRKRRILPDRARRLEGTNVGWDGSATAAFAFAQQLFARCSDKAQLADWLNTRRLPPAIAREAGLTYINGGALAAEVIRPNVEVGQGRLEAAMLEEVGLLRRVKRASASTQLFGEQARYRDFFFDSRVVFPIQSLDGNVVGFAGRSVRTESKSIPKYLYSPGFSKSTVLYRGNAALASLRQVQKSGGRKDLYICEGLVDALRLESMGWPAVSILGAQASKTQIELIRKIADEVAPAGDLQLHIFLDRDKAGVRGSSKLAVQLAEAELDSDYIWPISKWLDERGISESRAKDPDSLLADVETLGGAAVILEWRHPTALAVVAGKLESICAVDDILDEEIWNTLSLGTRYRAATRMSRSAVAEEFLLSAGGQRKFLYEFTWYSDVIRLRASSKDSHGYPDDILAAEFIADEASRLNVARVLAKSGADRGEVPTDEAAWRRLEAGATAFNVGLRERLKEATFEPLEPLDAVFVARDFEKDEPRLKAMPSPEDLTLQQYMLSETLTERFDVSDAGDRFSLSIPAVRFYRSSGASVTTAEDGTASERGQTLSFAYQIDMDVLEGRAKASNQGIFRPYIECWREFIGTLRTTANRFDAVYALRLDLKRYYDRLYRSTVQDALRVPFLEAVERLGRSGRGEDFAPSFSHGRQNLAQSWVDWFCEQSFGYQYYHPETGRVCRAERSRGIPQGPVLSAWLATVALFPLDSDLRNVLEKVNLPDGIIRAGYARYVDDIFLIADSPEVLEELRAAVEDSCARLRLEAIPKGEMAPRMTPDEFSELLTEGKALIGSGPAREVGLLALGDGEAGFETWQETIYRVSALVLLSDRRLYEFDGEAIKRQVFTALNAHDLRPAELAKASRWLWFAVAKERPASVQEAWRTYWSMWNEVAERLAPRIKVELCPWLDPSLYALDGLELLFRSATTYDRNLSRAAEKARGEASGFLAELSLQEGFFAAFCHPGDLAPKNAGLGVTRLRRMFLQRAVCVRWIARQLYAGRIDSSLHDDVSRHVGPISNELLASLVRASLTDSDGADTPVDVPTNIGHRLEYTSPLRPLFLWLHEAIVLLGRISGAGADPLEAIRGKLRPPEGSGSDGSTSEFYGLLNLWRPALAEHELAMLQLRLDALAALLAVCHVDGLLYCLQRRKHLVGDIGEALPALPGVPVRYLVLGNFENDHLKGVSQLFAPDKPPPAVEYKISSLADVVSIQPIWEEKVLPVDTTRLVARQTRWTADVAKVRRTQPLKPDVIGFQELQWAADCFEALARVNYEVAQESLAIEGGELLEFVPAWPFITVSRWSGDFTGQEAAFSLYGPVVPTAHLANFAFARDGRGRLRVHEVPLANARLWRIGFAVTDALGMVDELERFRAFESHGKLSDATTAQYVLARLLGRLRGEGQPSAPGLPHPSRPHVTGSTNRALSLLRSFPTNGQETAEIQYLLSVEAETAAMRLQNDGHGDLARPGVLTALLAELAPSVFFRLTAKQLECLPHAEYDDEIAGERRVVAAWRHLDKRLELLETAIGDGISPESRAGWISLRRGVRASVIMANARALVFEMHLAGRVSPPNSIDAPAEWELDDPVLALDGQETNVGELFREAMSPKGRISIAGTITPLGWLAILAHQLNLYGNDASRTVIAEEQAVDLRIAMTALAGEFSVHCQDEKLNSQTWPFAEEVTTNEFLEQSAFEAGIQLLQSIQRCLGYSVRVCRSHIWGLSPQAKWFTDERGRQWILARGLIDQIGRDRHVEVDAKQFRIWTETSNEEGKLVGVSVLGETFSKTVEMPHVSGLFDEGFIAPGRSTAPASLETIRRLHDTVRLPSEAILMTPEAFPSPGQVGGGSGADGLRIPPLAKDDGETAPVPQAQSGGGGLDSTVTFFRQFRDFQQKEWNTRRNAKNPGHLRFAVFQFKIDDTYNHPILDVGFPKDVDLAMCSKVDIEAACGSALAELALDEADEGELSTGSSVLRVKAALQKSGNENHWDRTELLPSWHEYRRRRLIEEAIWACRDFRVDVLVLPEYSVRPDTVEWLRRTLADLPHPSPAIVAGTYRLHGGPKELYFADLFANIFGEADAREVFEPGGKSTEKSAYLTLLQPILNDVPKAVGVFTRRKKYHSMAMKELINPPAYDWAPLGSLKGFVSAIEKARVEVGASPLSVQDVVSLARNIRPVDRMAELICSEMFVSAHPVNNDIIKSEYFSLRQRFGNDPGEGGANPVISDIGCLTAALKLDDRVDRRTILVVPACTTRSADYWIYGQSALLAAGLTTVFCAAVFADSKGEWKGGGSCFIANGSWTTFGETAGKLVNVTPYSGWSRGIYYNKPSDALSRKEQAIVIADIDPIYMNEGRPRPQALPTPIQLVAHLPVVEMVDDDLLMAAYSPENCGFQKNSSVGVDKIRKVLRLHDRKKVQASYRETFEYLSKVSLRQLVDASGALVEGKDITDVAKGMSEYFSDVSTWTSRLDCWNRNWREMPFFGAPPTLIDWIPVDLSPVAGRLPNIFVPPWGADFGDAAGFSTLADVEDDGGAESKSG